MVQVQSINVNNSKNFSRSMSQMYSWRSRFNKHLILLFVIVMMACSQIFFRERLRSSLPFYLPKFISSERYSLRPAHALVEPIHILLDYYAKINVSISSFDEMKNIPGNLGDIMWRYASVTSVPLLSPSDVIYCYAAEGCLSKVDDDKKHRPIIVHFPCANLLSTDKVRILSVMRYYAQQRAVSRVIVNGIGTQITFPPNIKAVDLAHHSWLKIANTYNVSEEMRTHLSALNNLPFDLLSRGDLTTAVSHRAGLSTARTTGCPSLFINEKLDLGQRLAKGYEKLATRINDTALRVGITVGTFPRDWAFFPGLLRRYPNSIVIAQTWWDLKLAQHYGVSFERIRAFGDPHEWIAFLSEMDLMFGSRIHGTMAAVAAIVPVVVIAVDYRVLELSKRMRIPYVTPDQSVLNNGDVDLARLASEAGFDPDEFDRNRCETAKIYSEVYNANGGHVKPHVSSLAQLC